MKEFFKKFLDVLANVFYAIMKKCDKLSESIRDKTGVRINFSAILCVIVLAIVVIFIIKSILGWVTGALTGAV